MNAIVKQLEFYFSDANLNKDKFLRTAVLKHVDQWMDLSVLITFNRLKVQLQSIKNEKEEAELIQRLVSVLESQPSSILELNAQKTHIRRIQRYKWGKSQNASVVLEGIPADCSFDTLLNAVHAHLPAVLMVKRSKEDPTCAWVEVKTDAEAAALVGRTFPILEQSVTVVAREAYMDQMGWVREDAQGQPVYPQNRLLQFTVTGGENVDIATALSVCLGSNLGSIHEHIIRLKAPMPTLPESSFFTFSEVAAAEEAVFWNERHAEQKQAREAAKAEIKRKREEERQKAEELARLKKAQLEKVYYDPKKLVHFELERKDGEVSKETVQTAFESFGEVKFVDFNERAQSGTIRFAEAIGDSVVLQTDFQIDAQKVKLRLVEGEEEEAYYQNNLKRKFGKKDKRNAKRSRDAGR